MNYWLDLFTGTTWEKSQRNGNVVSGFRESGRAVVSRIQPGDILLCYLTGVSRWVGALEVLGPTDDSSAIWSLQDFSVRIAVQPLVILSPEHGVPMSELEGKVSFNSRPEDRGLYRGFIRRSPNLFKVHADGDVILDLLRRAAERPIARKVDRRKLARKPYYVAAEKRDSGSARVPVTVPDREEIPSSVSAAAGLVSEEPAAEAAATTRHTEIQYELLRLGAEMGLDVWVARNDPSRSWKGCFLGSMPRMLDSLPVQFNEATTRTIELIDVLWLRSRTIVAAFEVECTTTVYSGLLRMSDLLALQPNLDIDLYIAAPDERREKVRQEIMRPTFVLRERPLPDVCGFLSFQRLTDTASQIHKMRIAASLRPDFLKTVAEFFGKAVSR